MNMFTAHDTTTLAIGGGDDWMDVNVVHKDHAAVGPRCGIVSLCRVCGGGIVYLHDYGRDHDPTRWVHVE